MCLPLRFDADHLGDHVVLVVRGDLDLQTAGPLRELMLSAVEASGRVELDMADVPFMDSSGLHVLAEVARVLQPDRGRVVVHRPSQPVLRLMQMTGLDRVLDVRPDGVRSDTAPEWTSRTFEPG
ncbi:MAG: STAS domain-containing protein [Ilumatobacteraceae bacterium]